MLGKVKVAITFSSQKLFDYKMFSLVIGIFKVEHCDFKVRHRGPSSYTREDIEQ